ncbi:hypothetical protein BESB_009980 [Besnoitia besnoiti]|uniref:Uncharacterized protein n=1 Tax=Besnoitia besnoiti TaxID=94643 RepID=A0A2A9MQ84_BESBE|nr:hypothetical protein BESB_009980 [Besnoitia besnoiti]PFH38656.1 hypothetical protein BESB_009980 [Besnoitia besnoiti]
MQVACSTSFLSLCAPSCPAPYPAAAGSSFSSSSCALVNISSPLSLNSDSTASAFAFSAASSREVCAPRSSPSPSFLRPPLSPFLTSSSLFLQHRSGVTPYVRPTEETVHTVEISDGFLSDEEEEQAHYPFVDAPLNLLIDPEPLRKEMRERRQRKRRLALAQSLVESRGAAPSADSTLSEEGKSEQNASTEKRESATVEQTWTNCAPAEEEYDREPEDVKTDLVELDRFYRGLGPWPSTEALQRLNATYDKLPGTLHDDTNPELHFRAEVKTIAEAQAEFERWRPRMGIDRLYWVLEPDEEKELPPHFLKRYKTIRRQLLPGPRQQFTNWLGENYVSPDEPLPEVAIPEEEQEPEATADMLRLREDTYTYTAPVSPIVGKTDMYDDPPDALWRRRVENKIRRVVEWGFPERVRPFRTGFTTYDVSWYGGLLDVVVMVLPGPSPPAAKLLSLQDLKRLHQAIGDMLEDLEDREQLYVLKNHQVVVSSLPAGAERRLLCCRKDYNLFAGSEATFVFDQNAAEVISDLPDEETAELLLEECATSVTAARRSLLVHEKAMFPQDFSLKPETAVHAEVLQNLRAAVEASGPLRRGAARSAAFRGDGEHEGGGVREREEFLADLLGRSGGEIIQGFLLGSPSPLVLALAVRGRVCYVAHDHLKRVYRTAPVSSPWVLRSLRRDGDFSLRAASAPAPREVRSRRQGPAGADSLGASPLDTDAVKEPLLDIEGELYGEARADEEEDDDDAAPEADDADLGDARDLFKSERSAYMRRIEREGAGEGFYGGDDAPAEGGDELKDMADDDNSPYERFGEGDDRRDGLEEEDYDQFDEGSSDEGMIL